MIEPPPYETIMQFSQSEDGDLITVPSNPGWKKYANICALIAAEYGTLTLLRNGLPKALTSNFMIFEATIQACAALFAIYVLVALYRVIKPPIPEKFLFQKGELIYRSGIETPTFFRTYDDRDTGEPAQNLTLDSNMLTNFRPDIMLSWSNVFPKETVLKLSPDQARSITFRDFKGGNQLTIDNNFHRLQLAKALSDVEREWLYKTIRQFYSLDIAAAS